MNKIIKNAVILTVITLVSGLALGVVYEITKEPIQKAQEKAKQTAYKKVLPDGKTFETDADFKESDAEKILKKAGLTSDVINEVAEAKDASGETVGYVITVTSKEGYGGDIKIATGIDTDGTVQGISILSISETAGLGMEAKNESFQKQFQGKNVEQFKYTKSGAKSDDEIDALSGATITTNAVTNNVNSALAYYYAVLGGGNTNE